MKVGKLVRPIVVENEAERNLDFEGVVLDIVHLFEVMSHFSNTKVFQLEVEYIHDPTPLGGRFDLRVLKVHVLQLWLYGELVFGRELSAGTREILLEIEGMKSEMIVEFASWDPFITDIAPTSALFSTSVTF